MSAVEEHADRATPQPAPRSAAFFDLDRTLMAGSSGFHFVRAAYGQGMISRKRLAGDTWAALRFRLLGSTDAATAKVRARMGSYVAGREVREMQRLAPRVLAGVLPRLYPQMLELAYAHQDAGRPVYICTAASQEMANALSYILGFDGAIGSRSEIRDGVYTGREGGLFAYREGKAQAVRELARTEGIALETSYAYSDSESDLPMLRAVGNPVAVNPDAALARVARDAGWEVLRFDTLHRRLKIVAALLAAVAGGAGAGATLRPGRARATSRRRR
ncbi:MAG TPA: HAD-IB family hydrolase [Solirubrobacteraceae bacterium]|nr:HAD-IB family hydrolase [Solirubrobacteraceae bacterium]